EMPPPRPGPPAESPRVRGGVVPVLGVPSRDEFRYAGGPAGQLQRRKVIRPDSTLCLVDPRANRFVTQVSAEALEADRRGCCSQGDHVTQTRMIRADLPGERDQVEGQTRLDEVGRRRALPADLGDLVCPMRGEGGDGYQGRLQAGVPGDDGLQPVGRLEEDAVAWLESELEQTCADPIGGR